MNEQTFRRLARSGKLPAFKVGGVWRFYLSDLNSIFTKQKPLVKTFSILLLDDEAIVHEFIKSVLHSDYCAIQSAFTGQTALSMLESMEPALIIMDLMLPDTNGLKFIQSLKTMDKLHIPKLLYTDFPTMDLVRSIMDITPITLVAKPSNKIELRRICNLLINQKLF